MNWKRERCLKNDAKLIVHDESEQNGGGGEKNRKKSSTIKVEPIA